MNRGGCGEVGRMFLRVEHCWGKKIFNTKNIIMK